MDKEGKLISYSIRVFRGRGADGKQLKPYTTSFEVKPNWTESSAKKKAEAYASKLEDDIKQGRRTESREKFTNYMDYVLDLKTRSGELKHTTFFRYQSLAARINPIIGYLKLTEIRVDTLNNLVGSLSKDTNKKTNKPLSPKTILEHIRLISSVLEQAVKESLIPFNPARRVTLPKVMHKDANYFQPETISAIREALENEPSQWKLLVHLLLITGARRGEILGLKWDSVDFKANRIHICNNVLYTPDRGIYEDTPKTLTSNRFISLPQETMNLLFSFRAELTGRAKKLELEWENNSFVFTQSNGQALHPDSVAVYLRRFSKRYNLPHINAHAFRHTMASILYFNGADTISISKRLGHAQASTTANIYAHIIEQADEKNTAIIEKAFLKKA